MLGQSGKLLVAKAAATLSDIGVVMEIISRNGQRGYE
jgi:hypothetical protein